MRHAVALALAPILGVVPALPAVVLTATVAAAVTAAGPALSAKAASGPSVAVVLVNGETTAPETALLQAAGDTVTQITPATLAAMSQSTFATYAAVVIGDSSTSGSCSTTAPSTSTLGSQWEGWVTGNVAVLGTAPARPGTSGADTLITDAVAYAAKQPASGASTGLYLSLNCGYSTSASGTAVSLLSGVDGIGADGGVTVNGSLACTDTGTVNTWESAAAGTFSGFAGTSLGTGSTGFPSPSCPVEEAFDSWPTILTPVAYDAGSDAVKNFTSSDGLTGQPYILLGGPPASAATNALAPAVGGQVPEGSTAGGTNPAAPGVSQAPAGDPVNTEDGDFTQSAGDVSVPGFGPSLSFSRTYDAQVAQHQTQTGKPGPMGYGWTDNWASSLSAASPTLGDIYTIDGLRSDTGDGSSPSDVVGAADAVVQNGSDIYIVDESDNHILEIPATTKTQWGRSMTAGKMYVVAGNVTGELGDSASGAALSGFLLNAPGGLAFDASGNMIIADTGNDRVLVVPAASGTYYGVAMTAGDVYRIAGQSGTAGTGGDGASDVSSYLDNPVGLAVSSADLYIADAGNNRVQEIYEGGDEWGQTMTKNDIYTVAGSSSGTSGDTVSKAATSALLSLPEGVALDSSGNLYIADTANNAVKEVAKAAGTQWGVSMTAHYLYDVAGSSSGSSGTSGDGGKATSGLLNLPITVAVASTGLYIADSGNNRVQEAALTTHTEWGISMTADDVYTVAGSSSGTCGYSGDGGKATSAEMCYDVGISVTASSAIYIADEVNNRVREVNSTDTISTYAGDGWGVADAGNGGPAVDAALYNPEGEAFDSAGDVFIADAWNNRIQEIAAHTHTQFGIAMTAGDVYTVAGNAQGQNGSSGDGSLATTGYLYLPQSIATDSAGNLYIADSDNCRIQKIAASTGDMSTVAGSSAGNCGSYAGNGGAATSATLSQMQGIAVDSGGDVFIADTFNNRVEEVYEGGESFGQTMTKGDIYNVAGTGTQGYTGNGGAATSAELYEPDALGVDGAGNLYISDWGNNRVREVPVATGLQRGQSMTKNDIYAIAGNGTAGTAGDGGPATSAELNGPGNATVDTAGDVYISDTANNRVQEVPVASGTQWGQAMTAGNMYTVVGSSSGASGSSGDGGPATSARLTVAENVSLDPEGDVYVTDKLDNRLREMVSGTPATIAPAPGLTSAQYPAPGGITVTESGGAQVSFYAQSGGSCSVPYVTAGGYCVLPAYQGATLTDSSGTYTFLPAPAADSYTFNSSGQLVQETDPAGDQLTIAYSSPAPGGTVTGNGTCPSTAASCETITAASGRALILGWSGTGDAGQITSVTDPMNRTWAYGYTSSDLTSVTDPMSNKITYSYGAGSNGPLQANDLLTITAPDAQSGYSGPDADPGADTVNVYNSANQVTQQTSPMGAKTTFSYCANAAAGDCMNAATGSGIVTVTDPDGNVTAYDYDQGTLAAASRWTGAVGTTLTSEMDSQPDTTAASSSNPAGGQLVDLASTDGDGNTTSYAYNADGNPTSTASPDGVGSQSGTTTVTYAGSFQDASCSGMTEASSTDTCNDGASPPSPVAPGAVITPPSSPPPLGDTYSLYDTDGNQLYTTTGVYGPSGAYEFSRTTYQLFKGNSVTLNGTNISCAQVPPSASLACATINADGVVTQRGYDAQGDLTSSSTPDGNSGGELATTTYTYNGDGEQVTTVAPDGNLSGANAGNYTTTSAYNLDGKQTSVTDGNGSGYTDTPRTTTYGYDGDGNRATVEDARGYTTTTIFNADDLATMVTNPDSDSTLTCYDGDGNAVQTVPPVGVAAGSLTAASCPTSYPAGYSDRLAPDATVSTFDIDGDLTSQTTPAPAGQTGYETTSYTYDADGDLTETTAPPTSSANGAPGDVTYDTYNTLGQLASQTSGYGTSAASTISYCYDPAGAVTSVVSGDGNASGTAACSTSSPWTVTASPQQSYQTTYSYDSVGDLVSTVTPANTASSAPTTTATYDPAGNKLTQTDPNGVTTTWTYTPLNLKSTQTYSGSSAPGTTWIYDADGNKTSMTDGTGTSSYVYNSFGELTTDTNGAGQDVTYGYDADGDNTSLGYPLPAAATWATSDSISYGYDNADRLTSVTDFTGGKITMANTADGPTSSEILGSSGDTISAADSATDGPSEISLTNSSGTLQSFSYADAPAGNILTETDTPASSNSPAGYSYDARQQVTSDTPGSGTTDDYAYDASGNLTTLPTGATGTYNDADELTSSALSGATTDYSYDTDGELLSATQGGTTSASATWNGAQQLTAYADNTADMTTASYDGNGLRASTTITPSGGSATTENYVWDNDSLLMDSANAYIYGSDERTPIEQVSLATGTVTYLVTDALGSVRGTVNSAGALTGTTAYDAWGNPETAGGLTATSPFGYAGGYTDPDGLIYLINRYYQPATGQFISVDPDVAETNLPYAYATGDPVDDTDPLGLYTLSACLGFNGEYGILAGSAGLCVARTIHTGSDDIGITLTVAGGLGFGENAGGSLYYEVSNCRTLYCLDSWFAYFGWGWDEGVGLTVFWGGWNRWGVPSTFGADLGIMLGEGAEASTGFSYTWVFKYTCGSWDWSCTAAANYTRWGWDVLTAPVAWLEHYLPSWVGWAEDAAKWFIRNVG
jgi:RHS repeat-associated protein